MVTYMYDRSSGERNRRRISTGLHAAHPLRSLHPEMKRP
jgi:hypothetical protein